MPPRKPLFFWWGDEPRLGSVVGDQDFNAAARLGVVRGVVIVEIQKMRAHGVAFDERFQNVVRFAFVLDHVA